MSSPARTLPNTSPASSPLKRRGLILGAGAAGAAALAAKALPESPAQAVTATVVADAGAGQGYRLTPHVLRYYQTAKV
jgi:hypothetical protein